MDIKSEYEKLKRDNYICSEDEAKTAFEFVSAVVMLNYNHLKETEPYTTNSLKDLEQAEYTVDSVYDDIQELIEEGEDS